jgi:putative phage-type endonuclease
MKVINAPQGSPEWFAARLGKVTASRISAVIAEGKGGAPSLTRAGYMGELVAEILTGQPCATFQGNADTERGQETEPAARVAYESLKRTMVDECGLVIHPRIERSGASPDGLVGDDGLLEIKCPRIHVHLDYLLSGQPPKAYIPQMAWQAACCERKWVDFVSYCPAMPEDLRLFVVRYVPTAVYLDGLERSVVAFLADMDEKLKQIAMLRHNPMAA